MQERERLISEVLIAAMEESEISVNKLAKAAVVSPGIVQAICEV